MEVVSVDFCDAGIRYYDKGEVSKTFNSVGEADWEEVECKVRRGE